MTRISIFRPLLTVIIGIALLLPASFFLLTLLARICFGSSWTYYYIAPSFLQSPLNLFAFHKAQVIIGSLVVCILLNAAAIFRFDLVPGRPLWALPNWDIKVSYRPNWLNTAVALQAILLLITLTAYTLIQHIRY